MASITATNPGFFEIAEADYSALFLSTWKRLNQRFRKIECQQHYAVDNDASFRAFQCGETAEAVRLFRAGLKPDYKYLIDISRKNLDYSRVHVVKYPMSEYLLYELDTYRISACYGQRIFLIDHQQAVDLGLDECCDIMTFDSYAVILLKYDSAGTRTGIVASEDSDIIAAHNTLSDRLLRHSLSLGMFDDQLRHR